MSNAEFSNCFYCKEPIAHRGNVEARVEYSGGETGRVIERWFHRICFEDFVARGRPKSLDLPAASMEAHSAFWHARYVEHANGVDWSPAIRAEWFALRFGRAAVRLPDGTRWMSFLAVDSVFPNAPAELMDILTRHRWDREQHKFSRSHSIDILLQVPSLDPRRVYCEQCNRWLDFERELQAEMTRRRPDAAGENAP